MACVRVQIRVRVYLPFPTTHCALHIYPLYGKVQPQLNAEKLVYK